MHFKIVFSLTHAFTIACPLYLLLDGQQITALSFLVTYVAVRNAYDILLIWTEK